jgi:hypothetical protein
LVLGFVKHLELSPILCHFCGCFFDKFRNQPQFDILQGLCNLQTNL